MRPWSGDAYRVLILEAAGFDAKHLRKALQRTDEAMDATDKEGRADHEVRIRAADQIYGLVGLKTPPKVDPSADPNRPVTVHVHLHSNGSHAGSALPAGGVRLHLSSGNGDGA